MRAVLHMCLLLLPLALSAFTPQPGFDLIRSVGSSELIVVGHLGKDGTFKVSELLAGKMSANSAFKIENTTWVPEYLAKPLKLNSDPELMLFLSEPMPQQIYRLESTRFVAIDDAGALWAFLDSEISMSGNSLQQIQGVTKPQMLGFVQKNLTLTHAFKAILEQPSSTQRTEKLIRFLRENLQQIARRESLESSRWLDGLMGHQNFYIEQAAKVLQEMSREEADSLLTAVEQGKDDAERAVFLSMLRYSSYPPALFERIKPWVDPGRGILTRRMAFNAVMRCDYERGVESLIPMLRTEEPQLRDVLSAVTGVWPWRTHWPKSLVEPLRDLGVQLLEIRQKSDSDEAGNRGYAILHALSYYSHPLFVPVVLKWAESSVGPSGQASSTLFNMLGFEHQKDGLKKMSAWVTANKAALTASYDLVKHPEEWFMAYRAADTHLKPLLLRYWAFEDQLDENGLTRKAAEGEFSDEAKAVLAHLWERKRLSRPTQREIVQRYISFSLEKGMKDSKPAVAGLFLIETKTFPFPESAWVGTNSDIAVDRPVIESFGDNDFGSGSLQGVRVKSSLLHNVVDPDKQKVRVAVIYREGDIELELVKRWRVRWDVEWPVKK